MAIKNDDLQKAVEASAILTMVDLIDLVDEILKAAAETMNLAPNAGIDTYRLPAKVNTFKNLFLYLVEIQDVLAGRDNAVLTKDWDVAKDGRLKLYKTFACGIHALRSYLLVEANKDVVSTKTIQEIATEVMAFGTSNAPDGLSDNGTKMWDYNFSKTNPRAKFSIQTILHFLKNDVERYNSLSDPEKLTSEIFSLPEDYKKVVAAPPSVAA